MDEELGIGQRTVPAAAPPTLIVQYSAVAIDDLARLRDFLRPIDRDLANDAVATILAGAGTLVKFPHRAPLVATPSDRRLTIPIGRAAYLLDYRVDPVRETVTILRVRHSREAR